MTDEPGRPPDETWWVINGADLVDALRRAHAGEDPDILNVELNANSEHEDFGPET